MMKVLDLFAGIGGFSLGLERAGGFETVAFCEIEKFPRQVLAKHWPEVPQYDDVRTLTADTIRTDGIGPIDVITAGFPCQDLSASGSGKGLDGERSGLWAEVVRLVRDIQPRYLILENSPNLLFGAGGEWARRLFADLSQSGYDAEWDVIPLSDGGAPHKRERAFIVAYPAGVGQQGQRQYFAPLDSEAYRYQEADRLVRAFREGSVPFVCERHDGVSNGMVQLTQFGNSVGPQIPEMIGRAIMEAEGLTA